MLPLLYHRQMWGLRWAVFELVTFTILWAVVAYLWALRTKVRNHLARYIRTFVSLAKWSNPIPQDCKGRRFELCSPRTPQGPAERRVERSVRNLLAVHAHSRSNRKGGATLTVGRSKFRLGASLLGRAMLWSVVCGGHSIRFCGSGLTGKPSVHFIAPDQGPISPSQVLSDLDRSIKMLPWLASQIRSHNTIWRNKN